MSSYGYNHVPLIKHTAIFHKNLFSLKQYEHVYMEACKYIRCLIVGSYF